MALSQRAKLTAAGTFLVASMACVYEAGRVSAAPLADPALSHFDRQGSVFVRVPVDPSVPKDVAFLRNLFGLQQFKTDTVTNPKPQGADPLPPPQGTQPGLPDDIREPFRMPAPQPAPREMPQVIMT